jgi:hypothetical protein
VFILKVDKVLCFDTLLEVFILKGLRWRQNRAKRVLILKGLAKQVDRGNGPSARLNVQTFARRWWERDSNWRATGSEDRKVADKGRRSFLRRAKAGSTVAQTVLEVKNNYIVIRVGIAN